MSSHATRPPVAIAASISADGDGRRDDEPAVRDDGRDEHGDEERQRDERGAPVAAPELEGGAHDDRGRRGGGEGRRSRRSGPGARSVLTPHSDSRSLRRRSYSGRALVT